MSGACWPMLGQMTGGSSREPHLDVKPVDNSEAEDALRAAETVYQLAMRQIPPEVEMSQELLIYPEGEGDAVIITERDMAELQSGRFIGNNIVDFYIRFLEMGLSCESRNRFYFFNSFFFTKLLQSTASTGIDPCKVDYEQVRKWTEEVNLFARDYVFIPILKSSHWSLVIICHLSHLTRPPGGTRRSPCVFHLDPIEGQHESFEGLIRSYVLQAWMERFEASRNMDQLLSLCQMKYVEAKVPRQDNFHDCGLYVLNYIEAFLVESTSSDFSFTSSASGPHFVSPHFVPAVLGKRMHIESLIHELSGISQKRAKKRKAIQEVLESTQRLRSLLFDEGYSEACIKVVQNVGWSMVKDPTLFNGQGCEIMSVSTHEDAITAQHPPSTLISRGDNESFDSPQIGHVEYENQSESLSPKKQYVGHEVQVVSTSNLNTPIFEAKHASMHEDSMDAQHQQPSKISRLDYDPSNVLELHHVENQRVIESVLDQLQHPEPKEIPCMDLFEAEVEESEKGKQTWVLLSCKLEGGRFCKESKGGTHWNLISEEIGLKVGSKPSANQCRRRYDTLLKAYKTYKKYCERSGKTFSEITETERLDLKLATTLTKRWYEAMDETCNKGNVSHKRMKRSFNANNDLQPLHSLDAPAPNPPPISLEGSSFQNEAVTLDNAGGTVKIALRNVIPASVLSSLNDDLQSTLLNVVQECSLRGTWTWENGKVFSLELVCRRLAILEDREPRDILNYVLKLWELELVHVEGKVFEEEKDLLEGEDLLDPAHWKCERWFLKFCVYEEIWKEVLCKKPHLKTYCTSFPFEQCSLQYIRVLKLVWCEELKHLDLSVFPSLCSLAIEECRKLKSVTGWEVAAGLRSIDIRFCFSYCDFPDVQYLSSLTEIRVGGRIKRSIVPLQFSQFSQCTKLRRLEIWRDKSLSGDVDLENLKGLRFLEFLSLGHCTFPSIRGLSGLQALTTLKLQSCENLKSVLEVCHLKGLKHLDMSGSSVEDVEGVGELHSLMTLKLVGCKNLKSVPKLCHLKGLKYLDMSGSSVQDVEGVGELHSLITLNLSSCKSLTQLPFLLNLKALGYLNIAGSGVKEIPGK